MCVYVGGRVQWGDVFEHVYDQVLQWQWQFRLSTIKVAPFMETPRTNIYKDTDR